MAHRDFVGFCIPSGDVQAWTGAPQFAHYIGDFMNDDIDIGTS